MARISEGCSFHLPSEERFPWVMISDGESSSTKVCSIYSISEKRDYITKIPDLSDKFVFTSCQGWLVVTDFQTRLECFLLNLASMEKIKLPPFCWNIGSPFAPRSTKQKMHALKHHYLNGRCVLTAPPTASNCILAFFSGKSYGPNALIWRPGQEYWVEYKGLKQFTRPTVCNEKIYGFVELRENVAVCEMVDERIRVRVLEPRYNCRCRCVYQLLVGSCEDIFLVMVNLEEKIRRIRWIDVYQLNETLSKWTRVENIGDRVFFINLELNLTQSISCSATNSGLKGNCIYLTRGRTLYTFDIGKNRIQVSLLPCPNTDGKNTRYWSSSYSMEIWILRRDAVIHFRVYVSKIIYNFTFIIVF